MSQFAILLLLFMCAPAYSAYKYQSAATPAQIQAAIDAKYDETGPGAKHPETAYKTYHNLADALVGYVDDKDTKLPQAERALAYLKLLTNPETNEKLMKLVNAPQQKSHVTQDKLPPIYVTRYLFPDNAFKHGPNNLAILDLSSFETLRQLRPKKLMREIKLKTIRPAKGNPLDLSYYRKESQPVPTEGRVLHNRVHPLHSRDVKAVDPEYTYSYGVHDRHTGDMKAAHETRENDGSVRGYYTVMDPDGKQRTVHYTANDKEGFRAVVQRTQTNSQ